MKKLKKTILWVGVSILILLSVTALVQSTKKNNSNSLKNQEISPTFKDFTIAKEAEVWGNKQFRKYKLTQSEKAALTFYTDISRNINIPLRKNKGNVDALKVDIKSKVEAIDQAFTKMKIPENIIIYRRDDLGYLGEKYQKSIKNPDGTINKAVFEQVKKDFMEKDRLEYGYISTSLLKDNVAIVDSKPIVTKFRLLSGETGGYISPLNFYNSHYEILLPRNTEYIISNMEISKDGKSIIIDALIKK